jgi:hypothetical protein
MTTVDPVRDADEHQVRLTEREALANVRTVLELCAAGELRCSDKTNRPTAATMRTIDAHLVHGVFYAEERIAAVAWPLLVQAGGLAKLDGTRLQLARKGRAALENPPAETIRHLWRRWLTHAVIDEFSRIEQIKGQRARAMYLPRPNPAARRSPWRWPTVHPVDVVPTMGGAAAGRDWRFFLAQNTPAIVMIVMGGSGTMMEYDSLTIATSTSSAELARRAQPTALLLRT